MEYILAGSIASLRIGKSLYKPVLFSLPFYIDTRGNAEGKATGNETSAVEISDS